MKRICTLFLICLACMATFLPAHCWAAKTKVAVLDFELQGKGFETEDMGAIVAEWFITALVKKGRFEVVERAMLQKILDEQKLSMSGLMDESTAGKIGQLLGVQIIISGSLLRLNDIVEINARIIDVESASIMAAENVKSMDAGQIYVLVERMTERIMGYFPLQGYVVLRKSKAVKIDLGRNSGVRPEMQFVVYKEGKVIKHPRTGEVLDVEQIVTGRIQVQKIRDRLSDAEIIGELQPDAIQNGQKIRTINEQDMMLTGQDFQPQPPVEDTPAPATTAGEPPQKTVATRVKPPPPIDPEEAQRRKERQLWRQWQAKMQKAYYRARETDNTASASAQTKMQHWQAFLSAFKDNNPYDTTDDIFRKRAAERLSHWQQQVPQQQSTMQPVASSGLKPAPPRAPASQSVVPSATPSTSSPAPKIVLQKRSPTEHKALAKIPNPKRTAQKTSSTVSVPEPSFKLESFTNSVGMTFVLIPPGKITVGSPSDEKGRDKDEAQREITIPKQFFMQTTEVTQKQWQTVMGTNPAYFGDCPDCPVEQVSLAEVETFVQKLNKRENLDQNPLASLFQVDEPSHYRLPSENEWEYACRAGSRTAFFFGNDENLLSNHAWFSYNAANRTHPVAGKRANPYGLFDMYGNVYELSMADQANKNAVTWVNRGGSWSSLAHLCRSANRRTITATQKSNILGFRMIKIPK